MRIARFLLTVGVLTVGFVPAPARAHGGRCGYGPRVGIGIGLGVPWGGYYGPWGGYYGAYPYYYAPPVVVQQAPVVLQPAPTIPQPAPPQPYRGPAPTSPISTSAGGSDQYLQLLSSPDEAVRRNAVMDLGRMGADRAVDALAATLAGDASPSVRDAAARALGLIAAPRSLPALTRAAQADNDRDVRHSAQFAIEVIHSRLRQN